jgi:multidrug efflux pump subunit AcrB
MTITLAAVYTPIGFQGGLTGTLFLEFAITLAAAVVVSGIVAVTLSPVMSSRFVHPRGKEGAEARSSIGIVLVAGMTVGTIFTLFVVPVFYSLIAGQHQPEEIDQETVQSDEMMPSTVQS